MFKTAISALLIALSIALGAMAAHALENKISLHYMDIFKTGAQYQMYMGLGLLLFSRFVDEHKKLSLAFNLILIGSLIFSFTLYLIALNEMLGEGFKKLGMITPIGGVLMIAGWVYVALIYIKKEKK